MYGGAPSDSVEPPHDGPFELPGGSDSATIMMATSLQNP